MIGAGAIGLGTAWYLAQQGHDVSVYDPCLNQVVDREGSANDLSGTSASLGVLMGHVFRRSSGRGWRLRRRSMELWPQWIETLQAHQPDLKLHPGLLQIAEDEQAAERMESLAAQRVDLGLQMVTNVSLKGSGRRPATVACTRATTVGLIPCCCNKPCDRHWQSKTWS